MSASIEPAPAVEVAALLGDSVVGVTHCLDPRGGRITRTTWAYLALAAAGLLAAASACGIAIHVAASNAAALAAWTGAHRPAWAFRAHLLGPAYDLAAAGGAALGLVAAAIGLARVRRERRAPGFRIGTAPGVDLAVAGAPSASFPLIAPVDGRFVCHVAPGIDGELAAGGAITPLAAARGARPSPHVAGALALPIDPDTRIRARVGGVTLVIAAVAPPRRYAPPLFTLERRTVRYAAGSLVAHLGVLALLACVPVDGSGVDLGLGVTETPTAHLGLAAHEDAVELGAHAAAGDAGHDAPDAAALAMALPATSPAMAPSDARTSSGGGAAGPAAPAETRAQAIERARTAGVLGETLSFQQLVDASDQRGALDGLVGDGGFYAGENDGLAGNGGGFGIGPRTLGPGGGGVGWGIIADGRYATIGGGHGGGAGYADGPGLAGRRHVAAVPIVHLCGTSGCGDVIGDYDKALIRRAIRQNLSQIRYCYERQLLVNPTGGGEVIAQFVIMPDGHVASSTATGYDATVSACVAHVIAGVSFPPPKDRPVEVKYPFEFHVAS